MIRVHLRQTLLVVALELAATVFCPSWAGIIVSDQTPSQGQTIEVTIERSADAASTPPSGACPAVTLNGKVYKSFPFSITATPNADTANVSTSGQVCKALLAVPADLEPGKYPLGSCDEEVVLSVEPGRFPLQHISLPPAKDNFLMSPGEEKAIGAAKAALSDDRLWQGCFSPPSTARVSAGFGLKRMVNGRLLKDYFHSGIDYAAFLGAPVRACADGTVVLTGLGFRLHGNTIAIDHGQGVVSFYIHLQKILVKKGQLVKQGQQIATTGRSGRATGPHLHYSLYVNQVAANPNDWFKRSF